MIHFDVNYLIHPVSAEVPTKHLADIEDKIPENYSQFQSLDSKKSPSVQQLSNRVDGGPGRSCVGISGILALWPRAPQPATEQETLSHKGMPSPQGTGFPWLPASHLGCSSLTNGVTGQRSFLRSPPCTTHGLNFFQL